MANAHIQLPADSTGKMLATDTWVNSETQTVHGQDFVLYGPDGAVISRQASGSKNAIDVNIAASESGQPQSSQVITSAAAPGIPNTANTASTCIAPVSDQGNVTFTITGGNFTGAYWFAFEASDDGGTTWYSVSCLREDGVLAQTSDQIWGNAGAVIYNRMYTTAIPGFTHFRVRCTTLAATVTTGPTVRITPGANLVEFTPQVTAVPVDGTKRTYAAVPGTFTAVATTAVDFLELENISNNQVIRLTFLRLALISSTTTAAGNVLVGLVRRSAHDTAGASTTVLGYPFDGAYPTSTTGQVKAYTAAPTVTASSAVLRMYSATVAASTGSRVEIAESFPGGRPSMAPILRPGESLGVYFNGAPTAAVSVVATVEWTEEQW